MRKNKLTILVGCPASGKSTYAEWIVKTEPKTMRISRDEIRFAQFQESLDGDAEFMISKIIFQQVKTLLDNNWSVVLDNCHTKLEYIKDSISQFSSLANIEFKLFDLPLDTLLKRNKSRARIVPESVIKRMYEQLEHTKSQFKFEPVLQIKQPLAYLEQDRDKPAAIICDLDGTLAIIDHRNPFDASNADEDSLNLPVASVLRLYKKEGYKILLVSGREERYREPTLTFLSKHSIEFDELIMRKNLDYRKDSIIKKEIFNSEICDKYFIEFVLDDRNQVVDMWRKELQLPCFQVNYGDF
jgi:predicted kinase